MSIQEEFFARIRLLRSPHVGPIVYRQLLRRFGDARAALAALPDLATRRGHKDRQAGKGGHIIAPEALISEEIAAVKRAGARYLFHDSPHYPPLLRQVEGAPPILIARGNMAHVQAKAVAMVGARNASAGAARFARDFARGLVEHGYIVVSGLARGIDTAVHRGALDAGGGCTIGVIACGIDVVYPPQNARLQEEVAQDGLLLTELPPGTGPSARQFPARNRIIAGLACGTVVVEAAPGSGSLITARLAADYGREVMAVPGSPLDPRSRGCNALIREGAILVEDVADVVELLAGFDGAARSEPRYTPPAAARNGDLFLDDAGQGHTPAETDETPETHAQEDVLDVIVALLGPTPVVIDELVRQSGAATAGVQMALVELELAGRLERHPGGKVSILP